MQKSKTEALRWEKIEKEDTIQKKFFGFRLNFLPISIFRSKVPHGWLVMTASGFPITAPITFIPFAEDGTGWGKAD